MSYVYKRGKTWAVRFSKRTKVWDPEKQQEVSKLKQKQKGGFKTKVEAREYGIQMEATSLSGVDVTKNPVFVDYMQKWFDTYKKPVVSPASKAKYQFEINIVKTYFGTTKIKEINRSKYQGFINKISSHYAPHTMKKLNGSIRACVNSAISDGLITTDFTNQIKVHGNEDNELKVQYLSVEEMKQLSKVTISELIPRIPSRYMILTALYTGARLGEISALHWSDIDFENKVISITKSWNWQRHEMRKPKTKSSVREISVNSFLLDKIKELKVNNFDFIFANPATSVPPTSADVNSVLRSLLAKAGIDKDLHFHSLRHVHVAYLLNKGINIASISDRLGHENISTTLDCYAYLIDELKKSEDEKIVSDLNELSN